MLILHKFDVKLKFPVFSNCFLRRLIIINQSMKCINIIIIKK